MNFIKEIKINFWVSSVISILLGLAFVIWPAQIQGIIVVLLGAILILLGVIWIIMFLKLHVWTLGSAFYLFFGVIFTAVGIWMAVNPMFFNAIVLSIVGLLVAINGGFAITQAFSLKSAGYDKWWVTLLFAVAALLLGILVIFYPLMFGKLAVWIAGAILIYNGISNIWIATRVHKYIKSTKSNGMIDVDVVEDTLSDDE